MKSSIAVLALCASSAYAEPETSPYRMTWSFPSDDVSAITVDRVELDKSRFATAYELVKYLGKLPAEKPKKPKPGEAGEPLRELRVDQLGPDGKVRSTSHYVAQLATWRKRLGEDMVERLEDEFDAHLRMVLPRKVKPEHPGEDKDEHSEAETGDRRQATGDRRCQSAHRFARACESVHRFARAVGRAHGIARESERRTRGGAAEPRSEIACRLSPVACRLSLAASA